MKLRAVLRNALQGLEGTLLSELKKLQLTEEEISALDQIFSLLKKALKADEELLGEHDYVAEGYDAEIDELRKVAYHSDEILLQYQQELVSKT